MLNTPRYRVTLTTDPDNPADETSHVVFDSVQTVQADVVRYDMLRAKHGWPAIGDAPMLWTTVLAWSALTRMGADLPREFMDAMRHIVDIDTLNRKGERVDPTDPDDAPAGVDPTPPGA